MPGRVLGLDINDHNTSAAVAVDGRLLAAAQEERFNREKRTRRLPARAMEWCLRRAGLSLGDLDAVAVSVNPAIYLEGLSLAHSERARYRGELLYAPLNLLLGLTPHCDALSSHLHVRDRRLGDLHVHYVTHHDAHAATAFYTSPFDSSAILSIDGFGEKETAVLYRAEGTAIERLSSVEFPHSVGCFYSAMTEFLGLKPNRHEWKLMAAAAHGDPLALLAEVRTLIRHAGEGRFEVNLAYFDYYRPGRPAYFGSKMAELLGDPYPPESEPDGRFFDIAAATQRVTEEVVLALAADLARLVPTANLCLTGGVAMNCVLNGKVRARTPFSNLFVPPMPDDSGTSIGAALHVCVGVLGGTRPPPLVHNHLGPAFDESEIEAELRRAKVRFERKDDPCRAAAGAIAAGRLVGWFQGGMEFGDRALGNRSILADPRDPTVPERLNAQVKDRRPYQPFAPSVLAERASDYFLAPSPSPFMEKTFAVRPEKASSIPAVLGPDGSARVHAVTVEQNETFHRLIRAFDDLTGVPLVLNTSFNLRGEPIVCSVRDALRTFFSSGLDLLFAGPFEVGK